MNIDQLLNRKLKLAVVGLGYVGLPLAVEFAKIMDIIGYDKDEERISELEKGTDSTNEVEDAVLKASDIRFTSDPSHIRDAEVIIIAVPTPIDRFYNPDMSALMNASRTVGENMAPNSLIIYESTVYPGLTEEECVPVLEKYSKMKWKRDFFVGYSPERVNPGDKEHTIDKIVKVVAGDTKETTDFLEKLYGLIIKAGVHRVSNIKTAEAAKVIENTQRDLNIAFMNELAIIFHIMGIDTREVLSAAGTKWNFLRFEPGLVGGHCIGVDPYYLTFRAESLGYHPQVILSGRRINNYMGKYIAENTVKKIIRSGKIVQGTKALLLGFTFKENIPDIRNTKVIDIYNELSEFGVDTYIYDPFADRDECRYYYNVELLDIIDAHSPYDVIISAVKHDVFRKELCLDELLKLFNGKKPILIDIKGIYDKAEAQEKGIAYWSL